MKYVSIADAKENFNELIEQLDTYKQDKIVVMRDGNCVAELVRPQSKIAAERIPGLGKGKFTFDDKLFDDLDEEIGRMFFKESAQ